MKISQVLLRWHKSFNINYNGYDERLGNQGTRPWNALNLPNGKDPGAFGFIEIPIEGDITTIVGANESGKSHLLDAICKVILGHGEDDRPASISDTVFSVTDLCHFSSEGSKDTNVWPNIGLRFVDVSKEEAVGIVAASGTNSPNAVAAIVEHGFVLMVAPSSDDGVAIQAYLFIDERTIQLDASKLKAVREYLPKVRFLRSHLPLVDEISLPTLIRAYGEQATYESYDANSMAELVAFIEAINVDSDSQSKPDYSLTIQNLKDKVGNAKLKGGEVRDLEAMLFRDVLNIKFPTLRRIANLKNRKRSYVENTIRKWNLALSDVLNLARYWQQDPSFTLQIDYKGGMLYFEITDKTGSKYTFGERSSGLRFFLSYYIQSKALQQATQNGNNIILMDEPDSFLSTQGQRNLLMVFEDLVGASTGNGNIQLIYTTHSPWLINRNFPGRIRLVRKGDAEEGTQYVHSPILRRYEPVRSALGIDNAQTLFMGATNLVLASTTDQYLLTELIRCFATPHTLWKFLDLNAIVTVSTDSVERIEQVLVASQWANEVQPATFVMVNDDSKGIEAMSRLTQRRYEWDEVNGKRSELSSPELLKPTFAAPISQLLSEGSPRGEEFHKVVSIEDIVPPLLYAEAVKAYLRRWQPEQFNKQKDLINQTIQGAGFAEDGLLQAVGNIFVFCGLDAHYDRFGVAQELILLIPNQRKQKEPLAAELETRLERLCRGLQSRIDACEQSQKSSTAESNVRRLLNDFQKGRQSASVRELIHRFARVASEIEHLGEDGDKLRQRIAQCQNELTQLETHAVGVLTEKTWDLWNDYLETLQKDTLGAATPPPTYEKVLEAKSVKTVTVAPEVPKPRISRPRTPTDAKLTPPKRARNLK